MMRHPSLLRLLVRRNHWKTTASRPLTAKRSISGSRPFGDESKQANATEGHSFIPKSTWSVRSLELNAQHSKLIPEELERLGHRALLDLNQLPQNFEQDLANMMHMVGQVSEFVASQPELFDEENEDDDQASFIYDSVRGVSATPFRASQDVSYSTDQNEAKEVWETYLKQNTIRQGGAHQYFSISTKQDTAEEIDN
jgi:hypothetical protein